MMASYAAVTNLEDFKFPEDVGCLVALGVLLAWVAAFLVLGGVGALIVWLAVAI